ncbi:alternative splicing regulator-domain-containing protein [Haematococcus lacustris]
MIIKVHNTHTRVYGFGAVIVAMADYYREARQAKRALKDTADNNKRAREKRRELGIERGEDLVEHPLSFLTIEGRGVKLYKNAEQHAAVERNEGLIPWNDDPENLIDRFDARSLLDFYRDPIATSVVRPKTSQEEKLHELVLFESYRDLIRLTARGLGEEAGLQAAHEENLEARTQARVIATAAFRVQSHQAAPADAPGLGMYSQVGFQYGASEAAGTAAGSSSSEEDEGDEGEDAAPGSAEEVQAEAEEERVDVLAERFGVRDFSYRLHRALEAEGEEEAALRRRPRKRSGRKAARERARRMAGQGLDPRGAALQRDWRDPVAMNAPSSHLVRPRRPSPDTEGRDRGSDVHGGHTAG